MITGTEAEYQSDTEPQNTPHTSPLRVSYGVSFVNICEKIDSVLTALSSICEKSRMLPPF